jgi:hypothetical protein
MVVRIRYIPYSCSRAGESGVVKGVTQFATTANSLWTMCFSALDVQKASLVQEELLLKEDDSTDAMRE